MTKKKTVTLKPTKKGQKTVTFKAGSLHAQLGVPMDETIPADKMAKARSGGYGPLAQKRANFAATALKKGQQTAAKHRKKKKG